MTEAATATAAEDHAPPARASVSGYVEARTQDRILGWAWDPASPASRQEVVLLAGERVLARTLADQHRDDLARNGIGDGAHAFAFVLDEAARAQVARLEVAVETTDGARVRLAAAASDAAPAALAQVQRGLAALAAGQRALMKAVQTPGERGVDPAEALAAIVTQQQRIEQAVGALEIFVTRLDDRLASLAEGKAAPKPSRGLLLLAAGLALAGIAALAWAVTPALG